MEKYTIDDLKQIGAKEFRAIETGSFTINRRGRRVPVTEGVDFVRTKKGVLQEEEWHRLIEQTVKDEGKEELLKKIEGICRKLAWLKNEKMVHEYALEAICNGSYLHWPEWQK